MSLVRHPDTNLNTKSESGQFIKGVNWRQEITARDT